MLEQRQRIWRLWTWFSALRKMTQVVGTKSYIALIKNWVLYLHSSVVVTTCGIDKYVDPTNFRNICNWHPTRQEWQTRELIRKAKFYSANRSESAKEQGWSLSWCVQLACCWFWNSFGAGCCVAQERLLICAATSPLLMLFELDGSSDWFGWLCCGADKYVDPANELCEWEQPKQYEGTKAR